MTAATKSGEPILAWLNRRSEAARQSEVDFDDSSLELRRLFRWLKERGLTAIITAERGTDTLTRHGLEEYISDCVILLDNRVTETVLTRRHRPSTTSSARAPGSQRIHSVFSPQKVQLASASAFENRRL